MKTKTGLYVLLFAVFFSCNKKQTLFNKLSSFNTGITFRNDITENDSMNILDLENIYNGGGVGIADFNNDGLPDIYFTGNMVANKLYINKGKLKFEDITNIANVQGEGKWSRGVSIVDINNDGRQDIYISCTILKDSAKRENILYINQGLNKEGTPTFKNLAKEYGLNDNSHTTQSAFFDYDNDGDLDVYMAVNVFAKRDNPNIFRKIFTNGGHPNTDRLYRNDWDSAKRHPVFTNISIAAGVLQEGFAHSVTVCDINQDGWKDVFVTNDYLSENLLYINNHNGTFSNQSKKYFKHTAYNAMGADVVDINNDGLSDVIELDMNPEDNYRKKTMLGSGNYNSYLYNNNYGYQYQYVRNMLHVNMGWPGGTQDSSANPVYSETGFYSGIAETDWSWAPLVADYDNDGLRDIIITNGFPRDVTDHDFMTYRNSTFASNDRDKLLAMIPEVKIGNYAYRNGGDIKFSDVTKEWGFTKPSFSSGAATADLDNDGDLDVVINNINDEVFLYENRLSNTKQQHNYLAVKLKSKDKNVHAFGAWVTVYRNVTIQTYEMNPVRGYLSSNEYIAWFGISSDTVVDSVEIIWPDNTRQIQKEVKANQVVLIEKSDKAMHYDWWQKRNKEKVWFTDAAAQLNIQYHHSSGDFNDYNIQKLLPHKLSETGPALSSGDINGDGLEDFVIGADAGKPLHFFIQQSNGRFRNDSLMVENNSADADILLFDADGDKDLDVYLCRGGYQQQPGSQAYQDALLINDGKGKFSVSVNSLPTNTTSKSCVRVADFDKDGDNDIFIAGRVEPRNYPKAVSSSILRNDSKAGKITFTDVTNELAPSLKNLGLICDATWADVNNDGSADLILVGEWMPVSFFINKNGKFENVTGKTGIADKTGWWNCIEAADIDKDGDIDFVAGNTGLNSFFTFNEKYPVYNYYKDFDKNGTAEPVTSKFLKNKKGEFNEFIVNGRDEIMEQIPTLKKRYLSYSSFAAASINDIFTKEQWDKVEKREAAWFKSGIIRNMGNGQFRIEALPYPAQLSAVKDIVINDFNKDGVADILLTGNDYSFEVLNGRLDAFTGLILKGDADGKFAALPLTTGGFHVPADGKKLCMLKTIEGKEIIIASQHKGPLTVFQNSY